jgi:DNA-binding MarR family transcriptional regulator
VSNPLTRELEEKPGLEYSWLLQAPSSPDHAVPEDPIMTLPSPTTALTARRSVPAGLQRTLTEVARIMLRLEVPDHVLAEGESIDRSGYWLLVWVSEQGPLRLSELAESVELDLSTVSRQMRDLVATGLITKVPDPRDGRAALLSLSERGTAVLDAVSVARLEILAEAMADWTDDERTDLAAGLHRLAAGLHTTQRGSR